MTSHDYVGPPGPTGLKQARQHHFDVDVRKHELPHLPQSFIVDRRDRHIRITTLHFDARVRSRVEEWEAEALDECTLHIGGSDSNLVAGGVSFSRQGNKRMKAAETGHAREEHTHGAQYGFKGWEIQ